MRRTTLIGVAALLVLLAVPVLAGPLESAGASPSLVGAGHPTCTGAWVGAIEFVPPLTTAGVAPRETIEIKAVAKPCANGVPVPASGTVTSVKTFIAVNANRCANVLPPLPVSAPVRPIAPQVKVTWPVPIVPTMINFPNLTVQSVGAGQPVRFRSIGPTTLGSSYPNAAASIFIRTIKTWAVMTGGGAGNCAGTGVSSLTIRAAGTTGTF